MHSVEYGKFGIVLTDTFLRVKGIRPVQYYTEQSLWNDPLIKRWNHDLKRLPVKEKAELEKEIVSYRKPATLFPSFRESAVTKISKSSAGIEVEYLTYDRYHEGYDFRKENECRVVFDDGIDYLYFDEEDLYVVIAPDSTAKKAIQNFLEQAWKQKPRVDVYPS